MATVKYPRTPFATRTVDRRSNSYMGRPCISETIARLVAEGDLAISDAILDVGCGEGNDLITLAYWGFTELVGLDYNRADLRAAKRRERRVLGKRAVDWRLGTARELEAMEPARFDAVFDTLMISNYGPAHDARYFAAIARILKPGGLFVLQFRDRRPLPRVSPKWFTEVERFSVGFAEGRTGLEGPGIATVLLLRRAGRRTASGASSTRRTERGGKP